MKQDNKKLYESIMASVAKEVKKALNEEVTDEQKVEIQNRIKNAFKKFLSGQRSNSEKYDYVNVSNYVNCLENTEQYYELVDAVQWLLSNANNGFYILNKFIQIFKNDFAKNVSQHKPFGEIMYISAIEHNIKEINENLEKFKEITKDM